MYSATAAVLAFIIGPIGRLIGIGAISAIAAASVAVWATSRGYEVTIAHMKADKSEAQAKDAEASLLQFQNTVSLINSSALEYSKASIRLNSKFDTVLKDLHNAQNAIPLPVDCKPDLGRLRSLTDAVTAASATAAGQ